MFKYMCRNQQLHSTVYKKNLANYIVMFASHENVRSSTSLQKWRATILKFEQNQHSTGLNFLYTII